MSLFLGIDGGGTKTACAVGDSTSLLAVSNAGGCNIVRVGEAQARKELQSAVSQACCQAKVSPLRILHACVGAAGAGNSEINSTLRTIVHQILPNAEVSVVGDMVIAHHAALQGHDGAVVISGTGSIAYGRNARGETARAGGWGYVVSDEGSGHWIGRTAVAACVRALDAQQPTVLFDLILQAWNMPSREALVAAVNATPPPSFAELLPAVLKAAAEKDAIASNVLSNAGVELAQLAFLVMRRLWQSGETVNVGVAGGVFAHSPEVRHAFHDAIRAHWDKTSVCFKITEPVMGALSLARRSTAAVGAG